MHRLWNRIDFAFSSAWQNFWRNAAVSVASVLIVWVVLLALGSLLLVLHSLDQIVALEKTKARAISVYLADTTPISSAMDFKLHLENDPRVTNVIYVSKDQAMARFRQLPALDPSVIDTLGTNPLPASLDVTVRDIRDLAAIDQEVRSSPLVDKSPATNYEPNVIDKIILLARVAGIAGLVLIIGLTGLSVFIIMLTIRTAIYLRRKEIEVMKLVGRVAATNLPVLITGESGTGKEIVAKAIHRRSPRADKPFVAVNCGALPAELIESELFGHIRGSFTGATVDRRGLWQEADRGTVFLDEITETSLAFQVKLLRALQEGEIRRVGSNQTQRVDVRVIAATNRDAELEVSEGRFRQDLLYRLNAVTIHLPALRDRREDIHPLVTYFAERTIGSNARPVGFSKDAMRLLENYDWPGNIRELENAVVRAAALCDQVVRPEDLPDRVRNYSKTSMTNRESFPASTDSETANEVLLPLSEVERRHILRVLTRTGGNKQAAARLLGIDRTTLQRKLERYDLEKTELNGIAGKEQQG